MQTDKRFESMLQSVWKKKSNVTYKWHTRISKQKNAKCYFH